MSSGEFTEWAYLVANTVEFRIGKHYWVRVTSGHKINYLGTNTSQTLIPCHRRVVPKSVQSSGHYMVSGTKEKVVGEGNEECWGL